MTLRKYLSEELRISRTDFLAVFLLLFNALTWTYMIIFAVRMLELRSLMGTLTMTGTQHFPWVVFHGSIAAFLIIGGILADKIERSRLLRAWTLLGGIVTLFLALFGNATDFIFSFLALGSTIGVGLPSCLACLADSTHIEERGRVSGVVVSAIALVSSLTGPLLLLGLTAALSMLAIWRFFGLFSSPSRLARPAAEKRAAVSLSSVLHRRSFLLYLIPWIMFSLIDRSVVFVLQQYYEMGFFWIMRILEPLVGVISTVIGGVLLDWVGRRRVTIFSFTILGLAYAVVGLAPVALTSWLIYSVFDGFAWGVLTVTFTLTLWADLSPAGASEKYYAVGNVPYFVAGAIGSSLAPVLILIPVSRAFSFACLFLFAAILPLWFAEETVPDEVFERRRFRNYIREAKGVLRRYGQGA